MSSIKTFYYDCIGAQISRFASYYDRIIQIEARTSDHGKLLDRITHKSKTLLQPPSSCPDLRNESSSRTLLLLDGIFNTHMDIQGFLENLRSKLSRTSRLAAVIYNPYFSALPSVFITESELRNLVKLAGFEVVKIRPIVHSPMRLLGLGHWINRIMPAIPFFRWATAFVSLAILRPVALTASSSNQDESPSLAVIVPARNESGNIRALLDRMPIVTPKMEVIFVEGHSKDDTWQEIQKLCNQYRGPIHLSAYQQSGVGKNDAVRLGFSKAKSDLLTILDADLTMPPELLGRFYDAYCRGYADFINGSRLVYPMEDNAMRFLNRLGNIFFAKALSFVLECKIGDSLCGTKLLARHDYDRVIAWRQDFGDFDPFGDFELLFSAAILGLGIIDVPIRYRNRVYGQTNINRFRHGWMLLKMTAIGLFRVKLAGGSVAK